MDAKIPLTFRIYKGDELVREETLTQDIIKIGKLESSHLRIDDENVSRMHAVIEITGPNEIHVIDLGSSRGTVVNGQKVNKCRSRTVTSCCSVTPASWSPWGSRGSSRPRLPRPLRPRRLRLRRPLHRSPPLADARCCRSRPWAAPGDGCSPAWWPLRGCRATAGRARARTAAYVPPPPIPTVDMQDGVARHRGHGDVR